MCRVVVKCYCRLHINTYVYIRSQIFSLSIHPVLYYAYCGDRNYNFSDFIENEKRHIEQSKDEFKDVKVLDKLYKYFDNILALLKYLASLSDLKTADSQRRSIETSNNHSVNADVNCNAALAKARKLTQQTTSLQDRMQNIVANVGHTIDKTTSSNTKADLEFISESLKDVASDITREKTRSRRRCDRRGCSRRTGFLAAQPPGSTTPGTRGQREAESHLRTERPRSSDEKEDETQPQVTRRYQAEHRTAQDSVARSTANATAEAELGRPASCITCSTCYRIWKMEIWREPTRSSALIRRQSAAASRPRGPSTSILRRTSIIL